MTMSSLDTIRVLTRVETAAALGISLRTLTRMEAAGHAPQRTQLSEARFGYRLTDVAEWLDARRQTLPHSLPQTRDISVSH